MGNVGNPIVVLELGELQAAARPLGLQLDTLEIRRPQDIASALDAVKGRADALYVCQETWLRGPTGCASTPWRWPRACR
jgi:putative ABC transport system substrate-binding protein